MDAHLLYQKGVLGDEVTVGLAALKCDLTREFNIGKPPACLTNSQAS
jgi:hypothetical protein